MENHTIVTLKKGEGRTIKAGGAWIFDNEIDTIVGTFTNGDVVTVHDFDGYPMGKGFINRNSKIRIRLMTRKKDQEIEDPHPDADTSCRSGDQRNVFVHACEKCVGVPQAGDGGWQ